MDEDTGVKELLSQLTASDSSKEARHNGLLPCTCTPPELCFILTNMSVNHIKTNIHVQNMSQTMSEFPYMADCLSMFSACQSGTGSPGNFGWRWQQLLSFNQHELMGLLCAWSPFYSHRNIRKTLLLNYILMSSFVFDGVFLWHKQANSMWDHSWPLVFRCFKIISSHHPLWQAIAFH